jgi:hypothetical protein
VSGWERCVWHAGPRRAQLRLLKGSISAEEAALQLTSCWVTTPPLTPAQWREIGRTNGRTF